MLNLLVGIPIRSFHEANRRLDPHLLPGQRQKLSQALADHTAHTASEAGYKPLILTSDSDVKTWATSHGYLSIPELPSASLNGAAHSLTNYAGQRPWLIIHADLPCLIWQDLALVAQNIKKGHMVLAPSYDGGTTALGGRGYFPFAYGKGSFHRHLHAAKSPLVVVRPGLALDIDTPHDLEVARRHPRGTWLNRLFN